MPGPSRASRARPAAAGREYELLVRRSIEVVRANQAPTGAYLAAPRPDVYRHSWLRDDAFIADAMSRAGAADSAEAFFRWCAGVVDARRGRILDLVGRQAAGEEVGKDEHLHCRYTVDGREVTSEWSNFQLDGYGAWLWALDEHARRHGASRAAYAGAAELTVRYVAAFWAEPCFDWWEERWGRHVATLAACYAGLRAAGGWDELPSDVRDVAAGGADGIFWAARRALVNGRLGAELGDGRLDASLVAAATPFRLFEPGDPVMVATLAGLETSIAHGGVHRYPGDAYYGGGEWLLLAALLGWWYAEVGRRDDAWGQLAWIAERASDGGELPEQTSEHRLVPEAYAEWEEHFGPPPAPLLWSHAMFVTLALELGVAA